MIVLTIQLDSIKSRYPEFTTLHGFFHETHETTVNSTRH